MTVAEPQGTSFGLSLFLRRGDSEVALEYGDFLQGMEEFKALPSWEQRRTLVNEIFRVSSNHILSSDIHVAHPGPFLLQNTVFSIELSEENKCSLQMLHVVGAIETLHEHVVNIHLHHIPD